MTKELMQGGTVIVAIICGSWVAVTLINAIAKISTAKKD